MLDNVERLLRVPLEGARGLVLWLAGVVALGTALYPLIADGQAALLQGVGVLAVLCIWISRRVVRGFKSSEIGIYVSVPWRDTSETAEQAREVILNLIGLLRDEARQANSPVPIIVRALPRHVSIATPGEAHRLLIAKNATYMIWTTGALAAHVQGRRAVDLGKLPFTLRHRDLTAIGQPVLASAMAEALMPQAYRIHFDNDLEELRVVGEQLGAIAKYHVGLAAIANRLREVAIPLIEAAAAAPSYRFQKRARREAAGVRINFWCVPSKWPTPGTPHSTVLKALDDAERGLALYPRHALGYALKANCLFLLGRRQEAEGANDQWRRYALPAYQLNRAVFAMADRDFNSALNCYRQAKSAHYGIDTADFGMTRRSTIDWMFDAVEEHLGHEYNFGLAYLSDEFEDQTIAIRSYESVLPLLAGSPKARDYVTRRLAALKGETPAAPSPSDRRRRLGRKRPRRPRP